ARVRCAALTNCMNATRAFIEVVQLVNGGTVRHRSRPTRRMTRAGLQSMPAQLRAECRYRLAKDRLGELLRVGAPSRQELRLLACQRGRVCPFSG
ncbi:MAG TPA: hypothetical protein VF637_03760, partial [Sphingomicrobium sp.]